MSSELERPSALPLVAYAGIGVLAILGAISILGFVAGLISKLIGFAFVGLVVFMVFKVFGALQKRSA